MSRAEQDIVLDSKQTFSPRVGHSFRRQFRRFLLALLVVDVCALAGAFAGAYWLRFTLRLSVSPEAQPVPQLYLQFGLIFLPIWIGLFYLRGLYERGFLLGGTREYSRVVQACSLGLGSVVLATFLFFPELAIARGWVVFSWILAMVLVMSMRFLARRVAYALRARGHLLARTMIVSSGEGAGSLISDLSDPRSSGLRLIGLVSDSSETVPVSQPIPCVGDVSALPELLARGNVDELIVDMKAMTREQLIEIMQQTAEVPGVRLRVSTGLYEILATGQQVRTIGSVPLTSFPRLRLSPRQRALKAGLDYSLTAAGLILLSPLLVVLGLLVKATSPGPVLHRRRVMGMGGREFDALKFRTMHVGSTRALQADPQLLSEWRARGKIKEDPRVTPLGRVLRAYSLDELPQLWNVLSGEMSLVGPRCITSEEMTHYGPLGGNLLTVKPGMTGLWQVSGRADLHYAQRVQLDMHYIRNYSIWRDLQILFVQTIPSVMRKRGAY